MKGSTEQEIPKGKPLCPTRQDRNKERRMNNAGIQEREQWNMVCDGEICQLERRA